MTLAALSMVMHRKAALLTPINISGFMLRLSQQHGGYIPLLDNERYHATIIIEFGSGRGITLWITNMAPGSGSCPAKGSG